MAQLSDLEIRLLVERAVNSPEKKQSCADLTYLASWLITKNREHEKANDELREKIGQLESGSNGPNDDQSRNSTEARIYRLEKRSVAACIIIKGIGILSDNETKDETRGKVNDILTAIEVPTDIVEDAYRYRKSAEAPPDRPPVVVVRLTHPRDKGTIYKNVSKLKDTNYKISIRDQYPASMGPQVFEAEKKAWQIRKDSGWQIKTRTTIVRGKVLIQKKGPGDQNFVYME